jgi:hypothetical protein
MTRSAATPLEQHSVVRRMEGSGFPCYTTSTAGEMARGVREELKRLPAEMVECFVALARRPGDSVRGYPSKLCSEHGGRKARHYDRRGAVAACIVVAIPCGRHARLTLTAIETRSCM